MKMQVDFKVNLEVRGPQHEKKSPQFKKVYILLSSNFCFLLLSKICKKANLIHLKHYKFEQSLVVIS